MTRRDDSRITQAKVDQAKTNNDLQDERAIGVLRRVIMLSPESRSRRAPSQSHAPRRRRIRKRRSSRGSRVATFRATRATHIDARVCRSTCLKAARLESVSLILNSQDATHSKLIVTTWRHKSTQGRYILVQDSLAFSTSLPLVSTRSRASRGSHFEGLGGGVAGHFGGGFDSKLDLPKLDLPKVDCDKGATL